MKKIVFSIAICFLGFHSFAQLTDKLVPHLGFMYEIVNFETGPNAPEDRTFYYTLSLGSYYTISHTNDVASLGIDPSVNFGFNIVGNGYFNFMIQAPVFIMGRLGANATTYNEQKVGIGAGLGGNYTYLSEKLTVNDRRNANFIVPAGVVEATIISRGSPLTVRFHFALSQGSAKLKYKDENGDIFREETRDAGNFGFGLIYGF